MTFSKPSCLCVLIVYTVSYFSYFRGRIHANNGAKCSDIDTLPDNGDASTTFNEMV